MNGNKPPDLCFEMVVNANEEFQKVKVGDKFEVTKYEYDTDSWNILLRFKRVSGNI